MRSERALNRLAFWCSATLAAGIVAGILTPAGPGWDFANFYDAGHKILAGQSADLYDAGALIEGKPPQGHLAYYGTPLSAVLFAPLGWMAPAGAMIAFKIAATVALLIALRALYTRNLPLAEKTGLGQAAYRAWFLAAALLFQPFWTIYRVGGQATPIVFLAFVMALHWLADGRHWPAAAAMVAAVSIKPAFILALAPLALLAGGPFFIATAVCGAAAGACSVAVMGWGIHERFLTHLGSEMIMPWVYNSSVSVVVESFRRAMPALGTLGAVIRLLAAGVVMAVLLRARRRIPTAVGQRHFLFWMAALIGLLLMPIVWEHYLSILFIPLARLLAAAPRLGKSERALLGAICLCCCTQNLVFVLWVFERLKDAGAAAQIAAALWKSAPLLLFTILICRHWERIAATYGPALLPATEGLWREQEEAHA